MKHLSIADVKAIYDFAHIMFTSAQLYFDGKEPISDKDSYVLVYWREVKEMASMEMKARILTVCP